MSLPVFRTDPAASRRITWWACALGYVVTLVGVPVLAACVRLMAIWALKGSGITRTAIGPALKYGESVTELLMYSYVMAWTGALLSVPVVIWARWAGWFGWGTAMLTGVGVAVIVFGVLDAAPPFEVIGELGLPSALLGLAFWITVRLIRPQAFARGA